MTEISKYFVGQLVIDRARKLFPGMGACVLVAAIAYALNYIEFCLMGRTWIGSIVFAIFLGITVRSALHLGPIFAPGIAFCARTLLEISVFLMGATISADVLQSVDALLLVGISATVVTTFSASVAIGRILGLSSRLAILIGCGNSICGNSAVIAVAPIIRATSSEVAVAIAFTAVLGIGTILCLPLVGIAIGLSEAAYGTLVGLVVYAVPQVIAATAPAGVLAQQIGILVKLVRVLMLAPMCLLIARFTRSFDGGKMRESSVVNWSVNQIGVPWFIVGFIALTVLRMSHVLPDRLVSSLNTASVVFTAIAMAALGLSVHARDLKDAGWRVGFTSCLSLIVLMLISLGLLFTIGKL